MSSKYDQSGTEPSFLPPQGLPLQSSTPLNQHGRALLLMFHVASSGVTQFHFKVISRRHFFLKSFFKWAFARCVIF